MKKIEVLLKSTLFILSTLTFTLNMSAQIDWNRYENNPIIDVGSDGTWDSRVSVPTSVIFHNGIYKAWIVGVDETDIGKIGYATSTDGIEWNKYENNPVLVPGNQGEWDEANTDHACVLIIDSIYQMWYMGENEHSARIGYATSSDGINWDKYIGNPVLDLGSQGSWDENEVLHPSVVFDGNTYHMWYNGYGQDVQRMGYATSEDGINWTKYAGNPVLTVGDPTTWEDYMLALMAVIYKDEEYKMWYTGGDGTDEDSKYFRIGYATSPDGISWHKNEHNPVLNIGEVGVWDSIGVVTSAVMFDTTMNIYKMWYGGLDGSYGRTGYATSSPVTGLIDESDRILPHHFRLQQNHPNPFNQITTITYILDKSQKIKLTVYDVLGNEIEVLSEGFHNSGTYSIEFSASNLSSGIYYYMLQISPKLMITKKMAVMK